MPKVATPKSSPVKRQQAVGSSPAKAGSPRKPKKAIQVQDRAQWRPSTIPERREINKTLATANYHLNANDLHGLPYRKELIVRKINDKDRIITMYCYKERDVELKAWEKYGGPEGFEKTLSNKMEKFYAKHGTNSGKFFPKPTTYRLANDPMASGYVGIMSRPKHLPSRETSTPTLVQIKEQMVARGEEWLWNALNNHLLEIECKMDWDLMLQSDKREAMMLRAFRTLRGYPKRPASLSPSGSASFGALEDVLGRAAAAPEEYEPSENDEDLAVEKDHCTGEVIRIDWRYWYKNKVVECLKDVFQEHGEDGWTRALWLVYEKYMECRIGGPRYDEDGGGWYDRGKFWLHMKMED